MRRFIFMVLGALSLLIGAWTYFTYIVPLFMAVCFGICTYKVRHPSRSMAVAWVLTDQRLLTIHYDSASHPTTTISTRALTGVSALRNDDEDVALDNLVVYLVALPLIFLFKWIREILYARHPPTTARYWGRARGISLTNTNGSSHTFLSHHTRTVKIIGILLARRVEAGEWLAPTVHPIPAQRTISAFAPH
ncbi:MAG: hypothetical protein VX589_21430 [Myxococcota bacterium]|nr:hypothetical protein [Myxococcota bacterium]